jgi:hypothetical protein
MALNYTVAETGEFVNEEAATDATVGAGAESTSNPDDAFAAQLAADDDAFKRKQLTLDANFQAQIDAQTSADANAFTQAQLEITGLLNAETTRLNIEKKKYLDAQLAATNEANKLKAKTAAAKASMARQLEETNNAIKKNRIDYSLIDLTQLFEENLKLRKQLGLETGIVEKQPQPEIYVPRRRGFFRR